MKITIPLGTLRLVVALDLVASPGPIEIGAAVLAGITDTELARLGGPDAVERERIRWQAIGYAHGGCR